jgi:hypothetical protein
LGDNQYQSCVVFWWLWNTYASEWDEQRISMPLGKIDPIGGGSCIHISFGIYKWIKVIVGGWAEITTNGDAAYDHKKLKARFPSNSTVWKWNE